MPDVPYHPISAVMTLISVAPLDAARGGPLPHRYATGIPSLHSIAPVMRVHTPL